MGHAEISSGIDISALAVISIILFVIHRIVAPAPDNAFVFHHARFRWYTLLTSAYIHYSIPHLFENVFAYARLIAFPYAVCLLSGHRGWFWRTIAGLLLLLPIVSSLTSYVLLPEIYPNTTPITYGFSPVIAGVSGFLGVAIVRHLWTKYSPTCVVYSSVLGGLLFIQLIDTKFHGRLRPEIAGVVVFSAGLTVGWYRRQHSVHPNRVRSRPTSEKSHNSEPKGNSLTYFVTRALGARYSKLITLCNHMKNDYRVVTVL